MRPLVQATRCLQQVIIDGQSLANISLPEENSAVMQAIIYGVCRWYFRLDYLLGELLAKPLKPKDSDVKILLLIGIYQLEFMDIPDYAVVSNAVNAARELKKPWACKLVNAILRRFIKHGHELEQSCQQQEAAFYAHASWMITKIKQDWPHKWYDILTANNDHPPMILRVNKKRTTTPDYVKKLAAENIEANVMPMLDAAVYVKKPRRVADLPGFLTGECSVQDAAAQLSVHMLDLQPKQQILDACAAPGGKTGHIAECIDSASSLTACDISKERLDLVQDNLTRLGLSATYIVQDVSQAGTKWRQNTFDRILLDAPCSGSGVIRRHPDIKLLRRSDDIQQFADRQLELLTALWPLLRPGGILVYVTCSVFVAENDAVIERFRQTVTNVKICDETLFWGHRQHYGIQFFPGDNNADGFYYAKLQKELN